MQGRIYKGVGSFYTVHSDEGDFVCKARGKFRKDGIIPTVGDIVEFIIEEKGNSFITDILPRKNILIRPAAANIDKLLIVVSASVPHPDFLLVDKMTLHCEQMGIVPVIVINKCDTDDGTAGEIKRQYNPTGYRIYRASAYENIGIDELRAEISGCIACFAGQSAVGKTSLLNVLIPGLDMETGGLSRKTDRGRHTTRHAQLWETDGGGAILDTPGFSFLEYITDDPHKLPSLYPEMRKAARECRFSGCAHINEPDCAVKDLIDKGEMSRERYARYIEIYKAADEQYKHRFD